MNQNKYVPDLAEMQQVCSRNYALLLRVIPLEYEQGATWTFQVTPQLAFVLTVNKLGPYTEEMTLNMRDSQLPQFVNTQLEFRLYHDAQMAEVVAFQNQKKIRQSYPYPNPNLHHKDEKMQGNQLLKDWLNMVMSVTNKQEKSQAVDKFS